MISAIAYFIITEAACLLSVHCLYPEVKYVLFLERSMRFGHSYLDVRLANLNFASASAAKQALNKEQKGGNNIGTLLN